MDKSAIGIVCLAMCAGCGGTSVSVVPPVEDAAMARRDATMDLAMNDGFVSLFDGATLDGWQMAGSGKFVAIDGNLSALPGSDGIGLLWSTVPTPADFVLRVSWRRTAADDNSGVFVRFPDPRTKGYDNTAWVGVDFGFEIQIDDQGEPDGASQHRTGAIYDQPDQQLTLQPSLPPGQWNDYEIRVQGQTYTVSLNGTQVTSFTFTGNPTQPTRGLPSTAEAPRYIGLQSHTGFVSFRNVRIKAL